MSHIKAVRLLSCWQDDNRSTVSVTKADYDTLLYKVPPKFVAIDSETKVVRFVTLDKEQAVSFLKQEYNLHDLSIR